MINFILSHNLPYFPFENQNSVDLRFVHAVNTLFCVLTFKFYILDLFVVITLVIVSCGPGLDLADSKPAKHDSSQDAEGAAHVEHIAPFLLAFLDRQLDQIRSG